MRAIRSILGAAFCLAITAGCHGHASSATPGPEQPDQFHHIIRDAELSEQSRSVGHQWKVVQAQFTAGGYKPILTRDNQYTADYEYLIRPAAWVSQSGISHDLIIVATVDRRDSSKVPTARPNEVMSVAAGLIAKPNLAYSKVVAGQVYPARSAVGYCVATPEFRDALRKYPVVKQVEVTYDLVRDWYSDVVPYGFSVRLELGKSTTNDNVGIQLFFTVESGLDPAQVSNGQPLVGDQPNPMFGHLRYWGSDQWQQE
jgi:hypothetical protein